MILNVGRFQFPRISLISDERSEFSTLLELHLSVCVRVCLSVPRYRSLWSGGGVWGGGGAISGDGSLQSRGCRMTSIDVVGAGKAPRQMAALPS